MARRRVLKRGPCSRSNFNDPNRVSLPAFLPSDLDSLALAHAGLLGVDPVVGLYRLPLPLGACAIFGGSRLFVVGPDAAVVVFARPPWTASRRRENASCRSSLAGVAALWLQRRRLPGQMEHPGP